MRILIATVQVPFVRGGAEMHADGLQVALAAAGHDVEQVRLPFKWYPPEGILEQILAARMFDVTESSGARVDRVIGLRFPAYFLPHPNKVLWILHQHRAAYDLWGSELSDLMHSPRGQEVRDAIRSADLAYLPEARAIYANSRNVAGRLKRFSGIDAEPLYHPPPSADLFWSAPAEDFLYLPSRINRIKRHLLVVDALALCQEPVRVLFAGSADDIAYAREVSARVQLLGLTDRVEFLGAVGDDSKRDLYARCLAVLYTPVDEDYGYVTLEAMLARKPVITCSDSGGALEFVRDGETGIVSEPTAPDLASAMDRVWRERVLSAQWGEAGREAYERHGISWSRVVTTLTHDA
jgi:glycosyltransferase involved in cell wall biosynthesis